MQYETIKPIKDLSKKVHGPFLIRFPNRPGCSGCNGRTWSENFTVTVPIGIPKSSIRVKLEDKDTYNRHMPTDGSWREIVKSGVIKMTPGFVFNSRTSYHMASVIRNDYFFTREGSANVCCGEYIWGDPDSYVIDEHISWAEQGDFAYWSEKYKNLPYLDAIDDSKFNARIERTKTEVWSELIRQYDLGAELAELHETLQFGVSILKAARNPLQTLRDIRLKKPDTYMDAWMAYRYAIMPLVYSAQDIKELIEKKDNLIKTVRRRFDSEISNPEIPKESCFYTITEGGITANVMAKGMWNSSDLKMVGQIGLNPITTAWEVTPYSFVVDWFVNFGDYLNAVSGTWASMASQLSGCTSVRHNTESTTSLRLVLDERKHFEQRFGPITYTNVSRGKLRIVDLPLVTTVQNSYERELFNETDLKVVLSPYLNWKRLIDGSILSIRSLQSVLRKLR